MPSTSRRVVTVAIALGCGFGAALSVGLVMVLTGLFVSALLLPPVIVAAWYVGAFGAGLTIAVETLLTWLILPPFMSMRLASIEDTIRLVTVLAVSALAAVVVGRVRSIERRYRRIVEIASEGIWSIDAAGRTTFVNERMADLLGYTAAEMRGRRFSEFVRVQDVPAAEQGFENRRRGMTQWDECELLRKDGSSVWTLYAGTPIVEGGTFTGALAVVTDISQRKRDDATIRRQAEELRRADHQKDEFLAMLGHELRNPLAPIVTALKLMDVKGGDTFQRERAIIARQTARLSRLVDDLLDVSRIMRGNIDIHRARVDVAQVITQACETVAPLLSHKNHRLDMDVPDGLTVEGDHARLGQVVVNLLTNAAKYTPTGGRIVVTAEADGEHVIMRVRDNGVGISPDFLPLLFEPFSQKPQTLARSEGGLGLGLAIARNIVTAHGGTIEAYSEGEGHGSELVVRLPVTSPATASVADGAPTPQRTTPATPSHRILIVDDNHDAADSLGAVLEAMGHVTQVAYDAESALSAAEAFAPDVALLDLGLPHMDGYQLAQQFRQHPRFGDVQLVAVTGYGQPSDRARTTAAGFNHHFVKPVVLDAVLEAIETRDVREHS